MRKAIITLCFNRPEVVRNSIQRLNKTQKTDGFEKYLIDVSFPIPDKTHNTIELATMANQFGYKLLKPAYNRGVARNWMWAVEELELNNNDVIIGMDPDSEPIDNGWADALVDVLTGGQKIAYCGLTRVSPPGLATEVDESKIIYSRSVINTRKVRHYSQPIGWPMGGFSAGFVRERGIWQPRSRYGFIEHETIRNMGDWKWVMLDEFRDQTSDRGETIYRDWKVEQAQGKTDLDFEAWLKDKGLIQ